MNYHLIANKGSFLFSRVVFLFLVLSSVLFLGTNIVTGNNDSIPAISDETKSNILDHINNFDVGFTKNTGMKNEDVYFFIENQVLKLGFMKSSLIYMFLETHEDGSIISTPVIMSLIGSNTVAPMGEGTAISKKSYFIGSDPNIWSSKESLVTKVIYRDIYDNIDLVYTLQDGNLKYEFHVNPGADYNQIKIHWDGPITLKNDIYGIKIDVKTNGGTISMVDTSPVNYQSLDRIKPIDGEMKLVDEATYTFAINQYDPSMILIIDPFMILEFSTYFNANSNDAGMDIETGPEGNIYVGGRLQSSDFPTTSDSYDPTHSGSYDIFVMKLTPDGQTILFSTYVGGSNADYGGELAIDKFGNVFVTGYTYSANFPMVNPINDTYAGGYEELFVFKLSSDGKNLLYSTYIVGSRSDEGSSIVVDDAGAAYIVGYTWSTDFPTTDGAFNRSSDGSTGSTDIFVCKIKPGGGELLFSTYISGSGSEYSNDIILDRYNNMYIVGSTYSPNFPVVNPINPEPKTTTEADGFILKLNSNGGELLSSSIIGGNSSDSISKLALDDSNILYLAGTTSSKDFPLVNALNSSWIPESTDVFAMKISENLDEILYSSIIGGNKSDTIGGMGIDNEGKFYISGSTYSEDFPVVNPFQANGDNNEGFYDIYMFILDPLINELTFSTYITGSDHHDSCYGAFLDNFRNFYITGYSESSDFPMANPHNNTQQSTSELIVVKLAFYAEPSTPQTLTGYVTVDNKALLNWVKPSYEGNPILNKYNIYRKTEGETEYTQIGSSYVEYYIDMTFEIGTNYDYVVTSVNALGESKISNAISLALPLTAPDPPVNLQLSTDNNSIYISWDSPVDEGKDEISRYHIYRGTTSGEYELIAVTTQTSYYDSNIEGETRYYYVITAVSKSGESIFSEEKSIVSGKKASSTAPFIEIPLALLVLVLTSIVYRKKSSHAK